MYNCEIKIRRKKNKIKNKFKSKLEYETFRRILCESKQKQADEMIAEKRKNIIQRKKNVITSEPIV